MYYTNGHKRLGSWNNFLLVYVTRDDIPRVMITLMIIETKTSERKKYTIADQI